MSEAREWMPGYYLGKPLDLDRLSRAKRDRYTGIVVAVAFLITNGALLGFAGYAGASMAWAYFRPTPLRERTVIIGVPQHEDDEFTPSWPNCSAESRICWSWSRPI